MCGINEHIAFPGTKGVPCMYMHSLDYVYKCPCGRYIEMCIDSTIGQEALHGMAFHYTRVTYFEGKTITSAQVPTLENYRPCECPRFTQYEIFDIIRKKRALPMTWKIETLLKNAFFSAC